MSSRRIAAAIAMFGGLVVTGACRQDSEVAKREYVRSGDEYAAQHKYQEAVIQYRNAVQRDSMFGEARLKLAETYERLGDVNNARTEYVHAADLLPGNPDVQVRTANYLLLARQFEDAEARADKALAAAPNNVEAQIAKGNALAGVKDLDAAVAEIEGAIRANPERGASYGNLGAIELARGHRDQAEAAFKKATETAPTSVRARLALANFYWSTGNLAAAERELKAAVPIDPKDIAANRALAVFYFVTNRAADAEPYLKTVADVSRQAIDRFVLADYYVSTGRSAEAKTLLQALATEAQGFDAATIRLSAIAARAGDTAGAHKLIDAVLQKRPRNVDALVASATLFLDDKQYDQALVSAEEAVRADPRSVSAQYALAKVHGARQEWDAAIAGYGEVLKLDRRVNAARVELARLSFLKGKTDDAIQFAQEALTAQPGLAEANMILTRAMLAIGDSGNAEPHVKQLAKDLPKSARGRTELGQIYALKGDSNSARAAFEQALAIDPANMGALAGLVALDVQAKNPAGARARIDARLAANQSDPRLLLLAARLYTALGDVNATERSLLRVIEIDPAQLEAYTLLGQFYASQGRLEEARAEFERIALRSPKSSAAQTVIGMILQMQNRPADAQASYEKALAMDPKAAVAANNLAWIYAEGGGNLDVALGLAQTAKSQLPDSPEVSDTLGWVLYKKGLPSLAVRVLRESVNKSPGNAVYQYHLGLAYARSGDGDDARKALKQALVLDPKFIGSADARRVLAELKG
jgi:tetratricopeptide (TPR) repeat protein